MIDDKKYMIVPKELDGIDSLGMAIKMVGQWKKRKGEKDTEKMKRIYSFIVKSIGAEFPIDKDK